MPSTQEIMQGLLIFLRVSALMLFVPVIGNQIVPQPVKLGLIALLTLLLYPVVSAQIMPIPESPVMFILLAVQEILIAGMLALLANLIFAAVQFAGQLLSLQMGMAIANVFDPATSAQGAVVAQAASVLAMLMWLAVGAHHAFILALADSFTILPIGHTWSIHGWDVINDAASAMFVLAIRLSAPVLVLLFFIYAALGLISRAVPQIQVFFVSFPLTVGLGLLALSMALPAFMSLVHDGFQSLSQQLPWMLRNLAGH